MFMQSSLLFSTQTLCFQFSSLALVSKTISTQFLSVFEMIKEIKHSFTLFLPPNCYKLNINCYHHIHPPQSPSLSLSLYRLLTAVPCDSNNPVSLLCPSLIRPLRKLCGFPAFKFWGVTFVDSSVVKHSRKELRNSFAFSMLNTMGGFSFTTLLSGPSELTSTRCTFFILQGGKEKKHG